MRSFVARLFLFFSFLVSSSLFAASAAEVHLRAELDESGERVHVFAGESDTPILTHTAKPGFRPYIHPIVAPDGQGLMTQFSPGHHKHQTGLYWGFTRLNGRDYFHHPEGSHWRRDAVRILTAEAASPADVVQWQTVYDLLAEDGSVVLQESQLWSMSAQGGSYTLELDWTGEAKTDVTISRYDYGGLFLRMPWRPGIEGEVVNGARQRGPRAEGQRSVWLDVGMKIDGRDDNAHIAIFDHPQNGGFPHPWRVDGQMGVGPARAMLGDWKIAKGNQERIRHQFIVFTGEMDDVVLTERWSRFSGETWAEAQWDQAQEEGRKAEFLTPEQAVQNMTLQDGFQVNVYAAEPMITQPMAFCWDSRGRLWIAENRDYESRGTGFANSGDSRILILQDTDRDGVADKRVVFAEGIPFPAGMAVGMGGLWLGAPPNLLFIPDRDGNDKADVDSIEVRLTGWGIRDRHETLNSLIWGPDGWLYGCQGFATTSRVGRPAGPGKLYKHRDPFPKEIKIAGESVDINGGVWRYHPTKDRFEVVAHGFSNPWGIDYDARGQLFISACVIPHLWHVIPGGIYHRQGGRHFNRHYYGDIQTIADHRHRSAHGGARVYLSDAFPDKYQGRIFMANIHEHAVLTDILQPKGSGFVGHHGDDFALANNAQWIGFSVEIGPDGAVYVLDWHDADICGTEVLNKETGRVFRFTAEPSTASEFEQRYADLRELNDLQLVKLQTVESSWHARRARTILQHRATMRALDADAIDELKALFDTKTSVDVRLQAMWTLHIIGRLAQSDLQTALCDSDATIRAWSIQLLCEDLAPPAEALSQFASLAASDPSPVVRLYLAAALQRIKVASKWPIIEALAQHSEDVDDHNIPKMIWYGLEPLVTQDPDRSVKLACASQIPLLSRYIARRLTDAEQFETLVAGIAAANEKTNQTAMLLGMRDGLEGRYDLKAPSNWPAVYAQLRSGGGESARIALQLSQQFGDTIAAKTMLLTLQDRSASVEDRRQALRGLELRKRPEVKDELFKLLGDDSLRRDAIRAMAAFDDDEMADTLLKRYPKLSQQDKLEVVHTLAARSGSGWKLTMAIKDGRVPRRDIPAYVARILRRVVGTGFVEVWGSVDELSADKQAQLAKYRNLLKSKGLSEANRSNGRLLFNRTCASCHKLFGHGNVIGPDLTGANRPDAEYLLSNIMTPSATIQDDYKMSIVLTDDGRTYSGVLADENDRILKLQVADRTEPIAIAKSEIESRKVASISMMPDGILNTLTDDEVQDLFCYLQSSKQVELPK